MLGTNARIGEVLAIRRRDLERMVVMRDHSPEALVFSSREGTPLTTANVRRQLRKVLGDAGIEGVTPHMFRRTVATVVNEIASLNLATETARPHGLEGDDRALHPPQPAREPVDCGAARPSVCAG
jgi:integrase